MKSLLVICALACVLVGVGPAVADGVLVPASEQVDLPEVEGHFWLTFLYQDDWQQDADAVRLNTMFASDPRLIDMKRRCRVNSFSEMDPYMVERWRKYVGQQTPMIVLQAPDGQLYFKASKGNIPGTATEMVQRLKQSLVDRRPCPGPCPQPSPDPSPKPVAPVDPLPDTRPLADSPAVTSTFDDPVWIVILAGAGALVAGAVVARKKR